MGWWWYCGGEHLPLQDYGGCYGGWTVTAVLAHCSCSLMQATPSQRHGIVVLMLNHQHSLVGPLSSSRWGIASIEPYLNTRGCFHCPEEWTPHGVQQQQQQQKRKKESSSSEEEYLLDKYKLGARQVKSSFAVYLVDKKLN